MFEFLEIGSFFIKGLLLIMLVYVISINGKPLMPTKKFGMVRHLLKNGKAKVVNNKPFTIQLLFETKEYTQPITLGVDTGSKTIGLSATTIKEELFSANVELRTDIVKLISIKAECRKFRRYRKTRYRKPRFKNRKKPKGWLPPSVQHKVDSTIKVIDKIHKFLPINKVIVEVAPFDIQKIKNPNIQGIEYQQGDRLGFLNVREYVLYRDKHECKSCGKKSGILHVHHIESRKIGGNAPNNLVTLCDKCHEKHHNNSKYLKFNRGKSFKDAIQVTIISKRVIDWLKENNIPYEETYGYITKFNRQLNDISKSHINDAMVISGNIVQQRSYDYLIKFVRRHRRELHDRNPLKKGFKRSCSLPKYSFGFQIYDMVKYKGQICFIMKRRNENNKKSLAFEIKKLNGDKVTEGKTNWKTPRQLILVKNCGTLLVE
jgi:N6-L-threonylcarbamoyladenine synthase